MQQSKVTLTIAPFRIVLCAVFAAFLSVVSQVADADAPYFSTRQLRGHDLSADGTQLVIALSDDGAGANPQVLLSTDASFTDFRRLDLPDGYIWMHPVFSPDASHIAISGYCVDRQLCPDHDRSNIYEVELINDSTTRMSPPQLGFYQYEPAYSDDGQVYYVMAEDAGGYSSTRAIGDSAVVRIVSPTERQFVFPNEEDFRLRHHEASGDYYAISRVVGFRIRKLLDVDGNQTTFVSASYRKNPWDYHSQPRLVIPSSVSDDDRLYQLEAAVLAEKQRIWQRENVAPDLSPSIFRVTPDSAEIVSDDLHEWRSIGNQIISAADRLAPGRYLVAFGPLTELEQFFIHEAGTTTFLMELPDGVQNVWDLAASSDASVIAYTRGEWFDLSQSQEIQPLDHLGALVIIRRGQPVQYLD